MLELNDQEIAQRVQGGDVDAFGVLVERYTPKMQRYAHKFLFGYDDTQDVVQEVFVKAYMNIQSFDIRRSFSPWLYRIAHNEFITTIKKRGSEPVPFFDADTLFPHPVAPDDTSSAAQTRELHTMLDECLNTLNPVYREVLVLTYYEDMSYEAIADIMHVPISTVGVRLRRAREALKNAYIAKHSLT